MGGKMTEKSKSQPLLSAIAMCETCKLAAAKIGTLRD